MGWLWFTRKASVLFQKVAGSIPLVCMSKCPWARYWNPNCTLHGSHHHQCMNVCMNTVSRFGQNHLINTQDVNNLIKDHFCTKRRTDVGTFQQCVWECALVTPFWGKVVLVSWVAGLAQQFQRFTVCLLWGQIPNGKNIKIIFLLIRQVWSLVKKLNKKEKR